MRDSGYYLLIIFIIAAIFSFWKLGEGDLNEWDESEYGQNALEMIRTGDYVHYYYAGKPDTWNAKPPLSVWLIVIAYKLFGYNAFALRFFSAIASILFFIFAYKLVRLYATEKFTLYSCLILLSCKAIIGFHVGRTGDADALLVLFLTAFLYYFILFAEFHKKSSIYFSAIALGLAFYAKGTAAFLFIPGLFIYLIAIGKLKSVLLSSEFRKGLALTFLIISSWIFILLINGQEFKSDTNYGSKSVLETMFLHDTVNRLTDADFKEAEVDRLYFIRYLDVRLNIWNYFFYLSFLIGAIELVRRNKLSDGAILLSICVSIPAIVLLTFSVSKHEWYLAPFAIFFTVIITKGIFYLNEKYSWFKLIGYGVLIFTLGRQFTTLNTPKRETVKFFEANRDLFSEKDTLQILHIPSQDYFLYLNWYGKSVLIDEKPEYRKNRLLFLDSRHNVIDTTRSKIAECKDNYCLAVSQ